MYDQLCMYYEELNMGNWKQKTFGTNTKDLYHESTIPRSRYLEILPITNHKETFEIALSVGLFKEKVEKEMILSNDELLENYRRVAADNFIYPETDGNEDSLAAGPIEKAELKFERLKKIVSKFR